MASVREVRARRRGEVEIARELAQALMDWFPSHADYMDSALATWLVKKSHDGRPLVLRRKEHLSVAPAGRTPRIRRGLADARRPGRAIGFESTSTPPGRAALLFAIPPTMSASSTRPSAKRSVIRRPLPERPAPAVARRG